VTTQNVGGVLVDQGTLPLSSAAGQLAADFIESQGNGRPGLGPEDATNFAFGVSFDVGIATWTIDYYNIELTDRVALGANVDFLDALNFAAGGGTFTTVSEALTGLDANGTINRQDFIGLDDLSQFRFFSNSFDTTTEGFDIVGTMGFDAFSGDSQIAVAFNYNETTVDSVGTLNPISDGRVDAIEDLLPNLRGSVTWTHLQGDWRTLVRGSYFGAWNDTGNGVDNIGAEILMDIEVGRSIGDNYEIVGGIANMFDTYPERNPSAGSLGQEFSEASPFGFNGAQWYLRARATF
jgi:iron complex outermembrane receptor protein